MPGKTKQSTPDKKVEAAKEEPAKKANAPAANGSFAGEGEILL